MSLGSRRFLILIVSAFAAFVALVLTMPAAHTQTDAEAEPLDFAVFKERRVELRQATVRAKLNRCRARPHPFMREHREVGAAVRDENLVHWRRMRDRARAQESRCLRERMWRWYRTSGAKCIREHEGAWTANTGNGYFGGFQADRSFQRTYGGRYYRRWGTANRWPKWAQIHMAYRGHAARGWNPWPTTSQICGLA
jgi:hypothetical protein